MSKFLAVLTILIFIMSGANAQDHSLSFDGYNDMVQIDDMPLGLGNQPFTLQFHLKTSDGFGWLASLGDRSPGDFGIYTYDNGDIHFGLYESSPPPLLVTQFPHLDSNWVHLSVTFDAITMKVYFDGVLIDTVNTTINLHSNRLILGHDGTINQNPPPWAGWFNGNIDELSVWSRALSQQEIHHKMMTILNPTQELGLVGYWRFDHGADTTAYDISGNNNHGVIYGASWDEDAPFYSLSDLSWHLQIYSSIGGYNDNINYLGVSPNATNGFDSQFDEIEPPIPPTDYISLYFPHPEWLHSLSDNFTKDIQDSISIADTMQVWEFEVVSSQSGSVTLSFFFTDVPSVPVILEDLINGIRQTLNHNDIYTFTATADSIQSFKISIGDTTPPVLNLGNSFHGQAILLSDSTHSLSWTMNDGNGIDSTYLWFSADSGYSYSLVSNQINSNYDWHIPEHDLIYGGMLRMDVQDYAGNQTSQASDYVFAIAGDSLYSDISSGWHLWSAPLVPYVDTMETNLGDDFNQYWVTYSYENNGYTFDGFLNSSEGYWLGNVENTTIDVLGTPITEDYTAPLSTGWDLISNPLILDISIDSLLFTDGVQTQNYSNAVTSGWVNEIFEFDGSSYSIPTTIKPWNGYWIAVLDTGISTIYPIHQHNYSKLKTNKESLSNDWYVTFHAEAQHTSDNTAMIGSNEFATINFDPAYDGVKAPLPPGNDYTSLNLLNSDMVISLGTKFSKDIRDVLQPTDEMEWLFQLESNESSAVVSWQFINLPDSLFIGIDIDSNDIYEDLRLISNATIDNGSQFRIKVYNEVLGIEDNSKIPAEFNLTQNYPNPFNPVTIIEFALPKHSHVNLEVYNSLGKKVKTLLNESVNAGYHKVQFKGKNLASGVYFYRIVAGDFIRERKMLLLK